MMLGVLFWSSVLLMQALAARPESRPRAALPFYKVYAQVAKNLDREPGYRFQSRPPERAHASATTQPTPTTTRGPLFRPPQGGRHKMAGQDEGATCTHHVSPYHLISSPTGILPIEGEEACAAYGWQYAIPPAADWQQISWLLANCTTDIAGLGALAGYSTGGCQLAQQGGTFLMRLDEVECAAANSFPLLCQDMDVVQQTTTVDGYDLTTTTATTTTTGGVKAVAKRVRQQGIITNGYDVCPSSQNGYHLVYDIIAYQDAAQVCADLGWYLAEIPFDQATDILALYDSCAPWDVMFHVNAFDEYAGGACKFAYVMPWPSVWGMFSFNSAQCAFLDSPVLCQEVQGSASITAGTMQPVSATHVQTVFAGTSTVTEYVTEYATA